MRLTQKLVDALPANADRTHWDEETPGLGLRVQSGRRTWVVRYRTAGVQRQKTLAPGSLPLRKAREQAAEILAAARRGRDLVSEGRAEAEVRRREREQRERVEEAQRTRRLGTIVERYLADAGRELRPRTIRELNRYLTVHWAPLHDQVTDEIDRRTIVSRLEEILNENGPTAANRARAYLSMACAWAVQRGLLDRNPVLGIRAIAREQARDRVLSPAEIRAVWGAADPATDFGCIVRLLLLTAQCRDEVAGMRWSELDLDAKVWCLAGERTKNRRPHEVPLSTQALDLLRARPRRSGRDLVFGEGADPFSGFGRAKAALDAASGVSDWTLHDLRRSAVTHMAELGIAPHVIETVINHVSGHKGGIAGVYNRAAYRADKAAALQRWADWLEGVVGGPEGVSEVTASRDSGSSIQHPETVAG